MSDEPGEAGDSGSDATDASTSSDSDESAAATDTDSSATDAADTDVRDAGSEDVAPDEDSGTSDAPSSAESRDADRSMAPDEDAPATAGQPRYATDQLAAPGAGDDSVDEASADDGSAGDDSADDGSAGDDSADDGSVDDDSIADESSSEERTDDAPASSLAPVGAEAPAPDEGGTTSTTAPGPTDDGGGSSILSGGIGGSAPPDDEEMPLTEHIEEMLTRLAIVVVVAAFATLAAFPLANDLIIHMWYDVHYGTVEACKTAPQSGDCVAPHVYGPLELVLTRIRVAALAGLLVALPLGIYQTYRFMRPGLYPHERRYFLASVPFSLVLGIVGMAFAYFVLLPLLFAYFISYTQGSADLAFQLAETMNLILLMMGMLAIIFQIPLLIMLAIMMGITTRRWLERRRLYFWGLFLGVGVIFGPDPTGMAPVLLTATMVALFEGTLLLLRWTGR